MDYRRRAEEISRWASNNDFAYSDVGDEAVLRLLTAHLHGGGIVVYSALNQISGVWRDVDVLEFDFDHGSDPAGSYSCAMVAVDAECPELLVGPRSTVDTAEHAIVHAGIETEVPQFDQGFRTATSDPQFANVVLDQRMIAWMLETANAIHPISYLVTPGWLIAFASLLPPDSLMDLLDAIIGFHDRLPRVVTSIYPPHFSDTSQGPERHLPSLG
jgi:hypothetical protein